MTSRTTLTRLGISAAATALSVCAVTPALASPADDDWGTSWNQQQQQAQQQNPQQQSNQNQNPTPNPNQSSGTGSWNQGNSNQQGGNQQTGSQQSGGGDWGQHNNGNSSTSSSGPYQGVVTANGGLRLRSAPNRGSAIIRVVPQGAIVNIFCKTGGENVDGNSLWYLLTDGTWAWGAARYIDNIGPAPRVC
ncbi:SH3 domain-containing protein [Streptomyces geranii]|uniref:SH3 domain-containing protein n=1 Tax=Streptomyces geranii TaxID=2058923 RepID=UPI000D02ECA4|nr:SH3 domain-containing protein [Streptomyces geranii]